MKNSAAVLTEGRSPQGGVPQSRFLYNAKIPSLEPFLAALPSFSSRGTSQILQASPIFPDCKNTYSTLLGSPNLIFLQIRFIIILQKMRSRKPKKTTEPKLLLLGVKIVEVDLSKIDFSKFLCYNIYRKMKEIKNHQRYQGQVKLSKKYR